MALTPLVPQEGDQNTERFLYTGAGHIIIRFGEINLTLEFEEGSEGEQVTVVAYDALDPSITGHAYLHITGDEVRQIREDWAQPFLIGHYYGPDDDDEHSPLCHCPECDPDSYIEPDMDDWMAPDYGPPGSGAIIIEYEGNEPGLEEPPW